MSRQITSPITLQRSLRSDLQLMARQVRFEQLAFWRNRFGAVFTIGFSVIFLLLLGAAGGANVSYYHVKAIQYYVPGFASYGVMSACFNVLAIQLVVRRETGLLKRLRLSPLPTWILLGAIFVNSLIISAFQVVIVILVGRFGYHLVLPHNYLELVVALALGVVVFTALGVAAASIVPNQEAAGPMIGIVFFVLLFLSGLWFPLDPGSGLAKISSFFPVRHLLLAVFAPFDFGIGGSVWHWSDLGVLAVWGVVGVLVALRRFQWERRRP